MTESSPMAVGPFSFLNAYLSKSIEFFCILWYTICQLACNHAKYLAGNQPKGVFMLPIVAQIIGIIAMTFNILSFQCKKTERLALVMGIGSLLFSTNYLLVEAYASAGFNIVNLVRSASVANKKIHNNVMFGVVCVLYIIVTLFTFENWWTIVLLVTQLIATFVLWFKNGAVIRKVQFFFVSPIWLINNIFFAFTIGGIICELFTIASVIVSLIRYGKDGFEA